MSTVDGSIERDPAEPRVLLLHGDVWVAEPLLELGAAPGGAYLGPEDLHLSPGLSADLLSWHADDQNPLWRAIADDRDPARIGPLPPGYRPDPAHAVEGFRLIARMQRELGEHWKVQHSSSHSFARDKDDLDARAVRTILLRALNSDPIAGLIEVIGERHYQRPPQAFDTTPATIERIVRWRRHVLAGPTAEFRAEGADVAAALQEDLGLTAHIRYWAGDASPTP